MDKAIVEKIADIMNKRINIPFLCEATEKKLFMFIINAVLEILDEIVAGKVK